MNSVMEPIILGILISFLGFSNMKGNISSLHWYHRKRITEENRVPFAKTIGLGTLICGLALVLSGCLSFVAMQTGMGIFATLGAVVTVAGLAVGLGITFYAMFKYNKGIF